MSEKSIKVNSILNVIKTISSIIFPLITFPYISRVLQPENVGKVNFGASFVSYFSLIASLGISTYAIRECSAVRGDKKNLGDKASQIFSINIITTFVAYVLLGCSLVFFRKLNSYRTLIIIQSTAILFTTWGADWLNSAMEDFKFITIRSIGFQFISLILMFLIVKKPEDYLKYAAITVLSSCGASITNVLYRKKYCTIQFTMDMHWHEHFKPILLLFVMILAQNIFSNADTTMLGLMKGDYEVGIYSTAHKIENMISQIVSSFAWVVMPRMALYFQEGDFNKVNYMLKRTLSVLMVIGLPCIAGVLSLTEEIVLIVGGSKYISAVIPLRILMFSFAFSLLGGSFLGNMVLLPSKKEDIYMKICCITAIVNVILNYFLIPFGGAYAAAFTTAISSFLIMSLLLAFKDKKIMLNYLWDTVKVPMIGSIFICIFCIVIKQFDLSLSIRTVISIIGSIIIYCSFLYMTNYEIVLDIKKTVLNKFKK